MSRVSATLIKPVAEKSSFLGAGWAFPPSFSKTNCLLDISVSSANIKQSIDLILNTPVGSKCTNPKFGSELNHYIFKRFNTAMEADVSHAVSTALLNFEPRITVTQVDVLLVDEKEVTLNIIINYVVKKTNARDNHVFPFYLNEASNLIVNRG